NHLDLRAGDPFGDHGTDTVDIVDDDASLGQLMSCLGEPLGEQGAATVAVEVACIGDGQYRNPERDHGLAHDCDSRLRACRSSKAACCSGVASRWYLAFHSA